MKRIPKIIEYAVLIGAVLLAMTGNNLRAADIYEQDVYDIGLEAYIYAYPMMIMEKTRRVMTNVPAVMGNLAPMNQYAHSKTFPDHTFTNVVRPNADTLYSNAWIELKDEPVILTAPDTAGHYYMLQILDMWSDVIAVPGARSTGTKAGNFALVGPFWKGTLPDGVYPIHSTTNIVWIIGRTQTNGPADYANVHNIQKDYKLIPLSAWGKDYTPPTDVPVDASIDVKEPPPVQVDKMTTEAFFTLFAKLLKNNPPHEIDWPTIARLRRIGIVPGEDFKYAELDDQTRAALDKASTAAKKIIAGKVDRPAEQVNGWDISRENIGNYGSSYIQRAYIAMTGLGANVPDDALYPNTFADDRGEPLNGSHEYVMHFEKSDIPPVNAFWSLTMYNDKLYFVENPIERYAIGDRDALTFNSDGSLDLYLQYDSPGKEKESNWLPAPAGDFNLIMRLYWPHIDVITGEWNPPPIKKVK